MTPSDIITTHTHTHTLKHTQTYSHTQQHTTPQVSISEESRNLRAQFESIQLVATATNLELQETRSKLVSETREKNEIEEQQQQLTLVHENALENLAKTQEIAREMEDEIEVVKSELRGSAGELESFRESLDSAENLIISLQNDLEDMKTQVRT